MGGADLVREQPELQQALVGVDAVGEPLQQHRQQLALDRGAAGDPLGERGDVVQRPPRIAVADRGQTVPGGIRGQRHLVVTELGRGHQQGPVEDLLMQLLHPASDPLVVGLELLLPAAHGAGEPAQVSVCGGQHLGAPHPMQLHPVLDAAQEAVGLVHLLHVAAGDEAALPEPGERLQGAAGVEVLLGAAVDHLQQLHSELDVAEPAGAQLDVAVRLPVRDVGDHAAAHRPGVLHKALPGRGLPDEGGDHLLELLAQGGVSGCAARLQQGLELPGGGPLLVVAAVGLHRANQGAVPALGAQIRIDLPQGALGGAVRAHACQLAGQGGTDGDQVVDLVVGRVLARRGGDDVHDVHVGEVVQLPGTGLAHRQHRPAHPLLSVDGGAGHRGGGLQGGIGQIGQRSGDRGLDRRGVAGEDIRGGDLQQALVIRDPQRIPALPAGAAGEGRLLGGIGADGAQQVLPHLLTWQGQVVVALPQALQVLGVAGEEVAERHRRAQQGDQAAARGARRRDGAEELLQQLIVAALAGCLGQAQQAQHGVVSVGARPDRRGRALGQASEGGLGEETLHPVGAREAQPGQRPRGGGRFGTHGLRSGRRWSRARSR